MNILDQFKAYLKGKGVEESAIKAIVDGMPEAKLYLSAQEKLDERYTKLKGQKELLDSQLKTANDTIETLKKSNKGNEELVQEVNKYKQDMEALQAKYDSDVVLVEKKALLTQELAKAGAKHADLLLATMNLESVKLEAGKISGHEEMIKDLKERYADQFDAQDGGNQGGGYHYSPAGGNGGNQGGNTDFMSVMGEFSLRK